MMTLFYHYLSERKKSLLLFVAAYCVAFLFGYKYFWTGGRAVGLRPSAKRFGSVEAFWTSFWNGRQSLFRSEFILEKF